VPLKLSDERRKRLLAHFKTPRPKESFWLKRIKVPSLVTALVLVAMVALLAAMLLPALSKAKSRSSHMTLSSGKKGPDLKFRTWSGDNSDREEMAASAPPASAPTTVTLAPPPVQIILPSAESPSPVTAVTGSLADSGNGGVYSQNNVGSVNAWNGAAPLLSPATPPILATPAMSLLRGGALEAGNLFNHGENNHAIETPSPGMQAEENFTGDLGTPPDAFSSQAAGVANSIASPVGFGGVGGGFASGEKNRPGKDSAPPNANPNDTSLSWNGSGTDRSRMEVDNFRKTSAYDGFFVPPADALSEDKLPGVAGNEIASRDAGK